MLYLILLMSLRFPEYSSEWVSSTMEVNQIAQIDLLCNGQPIQYNNSGMPSIACDAFLIEKDNVVTWRIVILYKDKVVLLEQGSDPVDIPLGNDKCKYAVFSRDGRYVLVGSEIGTEECPECIYNIVDTTNRTVRPFPRVFQYGKEPVFWVDNNGSIAMLPHGRIHVRDDFLLGNCSIQGDTLFVYDAGFNELFQLPFCSFTPDIVRSQDGSNTFVATGTSISCYDVNGNVVWDMLEPDEAEEWGMSVFRLRLSANGNTLLLAYRNRVIVLDAETGQILSEADDFWQNSSLQISPFGNYWAGTFVLNRGEEQSGYYNNIYIVSNSIYGDSKHVEEVHTNRDLAFMIYGPVLSAFDNGAILLSVKSEHAGDGECLCLITGGDVVWQSPLLNNSVQFGGNFGPAWWDDYQPFSSYLACDDEYYICYLNKSKINIIKVEHAE